MKRNRFENEFERIRFENWNPGIDRLTQINSSYRSRRISLLRSDFFLQMYLENMKIDLKMNVKEFDRRELESRNRPIVSTQVNSRQRQISIKFLSTNISRE